MISETYLKEFDKENERLVISFEGDKDDVYELRQYAMLMNDTEEDYYRGFGYNDEDWNDEDWSDEDLPTDNSVYKELEEMIRKNIDNYGLDDCEATPCEESDMVHRPYHYRSGEIETIKKIETIVKGLPADKAYLLGNIIKYCDRAGKKDDAAQDLNKARNYAHRLVYGKWEYED